MPQFTRLSQQTLGGGVGGGVSYIILQTEIQKQALY